MMMGTMNNTNFNMSQSNSMNSGQRIKLYVGNVPTSARNSELKELFEKFGKVAECDILKEFAFVHMEDSNDAKAAIAGLNDTLWKGARIRVELSTTKTNKGQPAKKQKTEQRGSGRHNGGGGGMRGRGGGRGGRGGMDRDRGGGGDRRRMNGGGMRNGGPPMRDRNFSGSDDRLPPNRRGGGPIRDGRFENGQTNGGGRPFFMGGGGGNDNRSRPYPDPPSFDHRNNGRPNFGDSRGGNMPMHNQNGMPRGGGFDYGGMPSNQFRNGPPQGDMYRGGDDNSRCAGMPPSGFGPGPVGGFGSHQGGGGPMHHHHHHAPPPQGPPGDYFRGQFAPQPPQPPLPPGGMGNSGQSRYNGNSFENGGNNFGPPHQPRGGRYNNNY